MLAKAAFPSFFLTLSGFVLLLLVTLSVPIIKTIYLLHIEGAVSAAGASASTAANVGVFGICYKGSQASFLGIDYSSDAACTKASLGYTLDAKFFGQDNRFESALLKGVSTALVLNPIAAGFAVVSLIFSALAYCCASRIFEIITFLSLFLSSLTAWLAFALDLALVLVARSRIKDYTDGAFVGRIGNAVWLALAGAIILTIAICFAGCGVFGRYSEKYRDETAPVGEQPRRRMFWQRKTQPAYRGTY